MSQNRILLKATLADLPKIRERYPLPFVYDIADLYKEYIVFDLAFSLTAELGGEYDRKLVLERFRERVIESNFMKRCPEDIMTVLGLKT